MAFRGPFQPELSPDCINLLLPGEWPLSPVPHFLFLHQLTTPKPASHPILWQLIFFTKFNKLCKKLLKGFLKVQEDYYAHTTPFIGILTTLPPEPSDAELHWSLSSSFPRDSVHPWISFSHRLCHLTRTGSCSHCFGIIQALLKEFLSILVASYDTQTPDTIFFFLPQFLVTALKNFI